METWRGLAKQKLADIAGQVAYAQVESEEVPSRRPLLLVDGLLGTGAGGALREPVRAATRMLNGPSFMETSVV